MLRLVKRDWVDARFVFRGKDEALENYKAEVRKDILKAIDDGKDKDESFYFSVNFLNFTGFTIHCCHCHYIIEADFIDNKIRILDTVEGIKSEYSFFAEEDFETCDILFAWLEDLFLIHQNNKFYPDSFEKIWNKIKYKDKISFDGVEPADCCELGRFDFMDVKSYPLELMSEKNTTYSNYIFDYIQTRLDRLFRRNDFICFTKPLKFNDCIVFRVDASSMKFVVELPLEEDGYMKVVYADAIIAKRRYRRVVEETNTESVIENINALC